LELLRIRQQDLDNGAHLSYLYGCMGSFCSMMRCIPEASYAVVEEKTGTESAQNRPTFPVFGQSVDAGDLSV
jgi:hypothetical protein